MVTHAGQSVEAALSTSMPSGVYPPACRLTRFILLLTDHYLLKWEQEHRVQSERWRTAARSGELFRGLAAAAARVERERGQS